MQKELPSLIQINLSDLPQETIPEFASVHTPLFTTKPGEKNLIKRITGLTKQKNGKYKYKKYNIFNQIFSGSRVNPHQLEKTFLVYSFHIDEYINRHNGGNDIKGCLEFPTSRIHRSKLVHGRQLKKMREGLEVANLLSCDDLKVFDNHNDLWLRNKQEQKLKADNVFINPHGDKRYTFDYNVSAFESMPFEWAEISLSTADNDALESVMMDVTGKTFIKRSEKELTEILRRNEKKHYPQLVHLAKAKIKHYSESESVEIKVSKKGGRIFSTYSFLPSCLRDDLVFNINNKIYQSIDLDIKASQPSSFAQFLTNPDQYKSFVETMDIGIYEDFQGWINQDALYKTSLKDAKKIFMRGLNSRYLDNPAMNYIKDKGWNQLYDYIRPLKKKKSYKQIAQIFQSLESCMVLAIKKQLEVNGIPVETCHDSFRVPAYAADKCIKFIQDYYREHNNGYACKIVATLGNDPTGKEVYKTKPFITKAKAEKKPKVSKKALKQADMSMATLLYQVAKRRNLPTRGLHYNIKTGSFPTRKSLTEWVKQYAPENLYDLVRGFAEIDNDLEHSITRVYIPGYNYKNKKYMEKILVNQVNNLFDEYNLTKFDLDFSDLETILCN
jgi:hypothetical protein